MIFLAIISACLASGIDKWSHVPTLNSIVPAVSYIHGVVIVVVKYRPLNPLLYLVILPCRYMVFFHLLLLIAAPLLLRFLCVFYH